MQKRYKSEIIAEILDKQGHSAPDIHYESECIDKWINDAKGSYPKLNDYESEWLDYFNDHGTGEFPYETFTGTSGTIDNVVPYAYKSAILTGNTLINVAQEKDRSQAGIWSYIYIKKDMFIDGKKYFVKVFNMPKRDNFIFNISNYPVTKFFSMDNKDGSASFVYEPTDLLVIHINNKGVSDITDDELIKIKIVIIEYQDGMENWDIPYFEGMQSVQMPVLTTTGKNTFNIKNNGVLRSGWYSIPLEIPFNGEIYVKGDNSLPSDFRVNILAINKNEHTLTTEEIKQGHTGYYQNLTDIEFHCPSLSIEGDSRGSLDDLVANGDIVIDLGGEPYKSIILTVNEEIELRGVGDVKDTLNLMTGELTQRIGEVVLDGSEKWDVVKGDVSRFYLNPPINNCLNNALMSDTLIISDKLPTIHQNQSNDIGIIYWWNGTNSNININLKMETVDEFKVWLSQNPITVQYPLANESVKTVDLTIKDQNNNPVKLKPIEGTMHIQTSGNPINPVLNCEVPVEAITQNLASFTEE